MTIPLGDSPNVRVYQSPSSSSGYCWFHSAWSSWWEYECEPDECGCVHWALRLWTKDLSTKRKDQLKILKTRFLGIIIKTNLNRDGNSVAQLLLVLDLFGIINNFVHVNGGSFDFGKASRRSG